MSDDDNYPELDFLGLGPTLRGFVPGQRLLDRYVLHLVLDWSNRGVAWLAFDEELKLEVELRFLPESLRVDTVFQEDISEEAHRCARLKHPNIVHVHDFFGDETFAAYSMDYVDGDTLFAWRECQPSGVFEVAHLHEWTMQLMDALDYAHVEAKIVHGELNPYTLLGDEGGALKIADFGIARAISDASRRGKGLGVAGDRLVYMSPQLATGDIPTVQDDVYALGATLYGLLTGKPPFLGEGADLLEQIEWEVPPYMSQRLSVLGIEGEPIPEEWELAIASCLVKQPAARPQSIAAVAERLGYKVAPIKISTTNPAPPPVPVPMLAPAAESKEELKAVAVVERKLERRVRPPIPPVLGRAADSKAKPALPPVVGRTGDPKSKPPVPPSVGRKPEPKIEPPPVPPAVGRKAEPEIEPPPVPPAVGRKVEPKLEPTAASVVERKEEPKVEPAVFPVLEPKVQSKAEPPLAPRVEEKPKSETEPTVTRVLDEKPALKAEPAAVPALKRKIEPTVQSKSKPEDEPASEPIPRQPPPPRRSNKDRLLVMTLLLLFVLDCLGFYFFKFGPEAERTREAEIAWKAATAEAEKRKADEIASMNEEEKALLIKAKQDAEARALEAEQEAQQAKADAEKIKQSAMQEISTAMSPIAGKPWINSQGVKFVPAGTDGVLFSIWDVRVKDYADFVSATGHEWPKAGFAQTENDPAVMVSWNDANAYCKWLTKKEQTDGRLTSSMVYRLPADVEWSKAAGLIEPEANTPRDRNGDVRNVFPWGLEWFPPTMAGNYAELLTHDGFAQTSPVGSFSANGYGLYDMGGNVWQWCGDKYDYVHEWRVLRGASWVDHDEETMFSSCRSGADPDARDGNSGFRVVLVVAP